MMCRIILLVLSIGGTIANACVVLKDPTDDVKENTNRLQTALDSTAECVNITSGVWSTSGIKIRSNTRLILNERTRIEAKINVTQTAVVCSGCVRFSIESDILYALKNRYTSIMPNM